MEKGNQDSRASAHGTKQQDAGTQSAHRQNSFSGGVPGYPRPPVQEEELIYRSPQSERKKAEQKHAPKPKKKPEPPKKPQIPADGLLYSGPVSRHSAAPGKRQPQAAAKPEPPKQKPRLPDDGLLYHAPANQAQEQPGPRIPAEQPVMQVPPRQEPIPRPLPHPVREQSVRTREMPRQHPAEPARASHSRRAPVRSSQPPIPPRRKHPEAEKYSEYPEKPPRRSLWKRILAAAAILVLLLGGALALAANHVLGKFGSFGDTLPPRDGEILSDPGQTGESYAAVPELSIEDSVNIMLIGADASPDGVRSRSDTMILVTLNPRRNAIQMTSFMRDTYVHIPGYQDNRLNAAYRFGDVELMNETIRQNFGVTVNGNVMVDFTKFAEIIDLLGGVDVDLSREEANYMIGEGCILEPGVNHLSGADALTFVRMRYVSGGDYGRTERQRRVLTQLIATFRNADLRTIMRLTDEILPSITTNVPKLDIIKYVTNGLALLSQDASIETLQIPANDAHRAAMISEMSVLVPDLEMCREDLEEFFAPTAPAESTATTSE